MKIVTVIGARPQFIKAAPMSRVLRLKHEEVIVHTGQHYDKNMSEVFFQELDIPKPDVHLNAGGGNHGEQTAKMVYGIERVLLAEKPDWVFIYGDTNSTLAGALSASKLHIPIAHVEAGLRSFNRRMPEEINRIVADHLSTLLLCPSTLAASHLANEGIVRGVKIVGDIMADALLETASRADQSEVLERNGLKLREYLLATVHRAENTDDLRRLSGIIAAFEDVERTILFPLHPRTRKAILVAGLQLPPNVIACDPLSYLDMARALRDAELIMTDSGGLQKEAYWLSTPCVTLRDETEWVETVEVGWNRLAGTSKQGILNAVASAGRPNVHPTLFGGDGHAAGRILAELESDSLLTLPGPV